MAAFERITSDPAIMKGQPCIRGMRLTVRRCSKRWPRIRTASSFSRIPGN